MLHGILSHGAHVPKNFYGQITHCPHCDHDNEDLSPDEEGDLVCENCGTVIEDEGGVGDGMVVLYLRKPITRNSRCVLLIG